MKTKLTRSILAAVLGCGLFSIDANADTPAHLYTFETVDSYKVDGHSDQTSQYGMMVITGVLQGAQAPSTTDSLVIDSPALQACDRMAATMMNRPGRFLLSIDASDSGYHRYACTLTRRP